MTYEEAMRDAAGRFEVAGIETARLDARLLLADVCGEDTGSLIIRANDELDAESALRFENHVRQRLSGKPVFRILGRREFFGREFVVADNVLDPRPETELLVERVLQDWKGKPCRFAEIGVGSGAVAVTLLCEMPQAAALASDVSQEAVLAARSNARKLGVAARLDIVKTDCLDGVGEKFDFVVSNPPYIESAAIELLPEEVRSHDPVNALDGGTDGLEIYRRMLCGLGDKIGQEGMLYLETGHGQHERLAEIAQQMGWGLVSTHLDLSGLERIVVLKRSGEAA